MELLEKYIINNKISKNQKINIKHLIDWCKKKGIILLKKITDKFNYLSKYPATMVLTLVELMTFVSIRAKRTQL